MKWFQHQSDSHTDLKLKGIIREFGMDGYGLWWLACELVAQQGKHYKLVCDCDWRDELVEISCLKSEKVDKILQKFAKINLISEKSFKEGCLAIPKMSRYSDDYSRKRVRTMSGHSTDNIPLDKIRIDKNRKEYKAKGNKFPLTDGLAPIGGMDLARYSQGANN